MNEISGLECLSRRGVDEKSFFETHKITERKKIEKATEKLLPSCKTTTTAYLYCASFTLLSPFTTPPLC
jgi:hypothetical protein